MELMMDDQPDFTDGFYTLDGEIDIEDAARDGNLEQVIKTLERCSYDKITCEVVLVESCRNARFEIINYLDELDIDNVLTWRRAIAILIIREQLDAVKRILEKRQDSLDLETQLIPLRMTAEDVGNVEILDYLKQFESEWSSRRKCKTVNKYICESQSTTAVN